MHRQAERGLITAETLASLAHLIGGDAPRSLEADWRIVLKNEFHDILPGSSIREVYVDAERELGGVLENAGAEQDRALAALISKLSRGSIANAVVAVNPSLCGQPLNVKLADGTVLSTGDTVAPLSVAVFDRATLRPASELKAGAYSLENAYLSVEIGKDGAVSSLVHKATGREALDGSANQLWVYPIDKPRNWDAWDVDADYAEKGIRLDRPESIALVESGLHRAAIRVTYRYRDSSVTQTYVLTANARRLDIETTIDWHDRRTMLRTLNPVAVKSRTATFECAFGVIERTTHTNTSWDQAMFEAVAHRFVDLSEPGFGVALLNNAKYGHSARGNEIGMSLVRAPIYPDPLADEGEQSFTYALMPHEGTWHEGGVLGEAIDLNQPLVCSEATGLAPGSVQPIVVEGVPVALSGLKPAEEGNGLVARLYEPAGRRGDLVLKGPDGWTLSDPLNILEEPMQRQGPAEIMPFEIRTWRLQHR
jgi:alpha-mannosidase